MADIFQEVDEDVRRDKAMAIWRKYGTYLIIACVAIVVGTAGRVGWREYKAAQRAEDSGRYVAAIQLMDKGDTAAAITSFQSLSADASTGYGVIARFQGAAARVKSGDKNGAVVLYDKMAIDDDLDPIFQGLAQLQAIMLLIDDGAAEDLDRRLTPLLVDGASWRYSALEMQAVLKHRDGDTAGARAAFKALSEDAGAPKGMRSRATQMLLTYGGEG
ncbi:MAG: tetratricopeptide repeat protein [Rhodospirillaceae bacterium]|nr:tetratricopeptide repeat protein [Rhodospirillaceae bacterium]MBT4044901.1 tetratricopeptide repeat protein [Rhodospirillaceae bacterium]MBT4688242.1 tetratricopeptide repeat protein [Rhodospirillaceae bacterium]MBT5079235.1 tetratricopeptide repeat protein [Rhodospirillaceae bacterium]MBT5522481.1 tetratricopeptide repeat protein [Rhodospirillaceae bacterium]